MLPTANFKENLNIYVSTSIHTEVNNVYKKIFIKAIIPNRQLHI